MRLYLLGTVHENPYVTDLFLAGFVESFIKIFRGGSSAVVDGAGEQPKTLWARVLRSWRSKTKIGKSDLPSRGKSDLPSRGKSDLPSRGISDLPNRDSVRARLNDLYNALDLGEYQSEMSESEMSESEMTRTAKILKEIFKSEKPWYLDSPEGSKWFEAMDELNLYCLLRSVNIFDRMGVRRPTSVHTKDFVESVLGPIPHGMEHKFIEQFLVSASDSNLNLHRIIKNTFREVLNNLPPSECEHLDEVVYSKDKYENLANEVLKNPSTLNYSPDLLRICLELLDDDDSISEDRSQLVAAIQASIESVPNQPSDIRVARQINDLCLLLESPSNPRFKIPDWFTENIFDGSKEAIDAVLEFIDNNRNEFRAIGSAARTSYIRLVEELNLYCLSTRTSVNWGWQWDRPQLVSRKLVDVVLGPLAKEIDVVEYEPFLMTSGLDGSNRFLIRRVVAKEMERRELERKIDEESDTKNSTIISQDLSSTVA